MPVTHTVTLCGGGKDDVCAAVVGMVDMAQFRVGDEDFDERFVRDCSQQPVDAAATPPAPVRVQTPVGVELRVGVILVRLDPPADAVRVQCRSWRRVARGPVGVSDQSIVTTNTSVSANNSSRIVLYRSSTIAYSPPDFG
ncbi:hypothetical protein ACKI11_25000 [Streptomyces caniscabiei]|uniref:hypothetical protein n=1 Tax=Streptomyces caniscabiei TaxID=2746961 RepID=UPI0038F68EA7